jgi:hypothetical protein
MEPAKADHDLERLGETAEFIADLERLARALIGTVALGTSHEGRAGARGLGVRLSRFPATQSARRAAGSGPAGRRGAIHLRGERGGDKCETDVSLRVG